MQLREEIKSTYGVQECPVNDWFCKFFDNGVCKLHDANNRCSHMKYKNDKKTKIVME